jgi:hypothetical protein
MDNRSSDLPITIDKDTNPIVHHQRLVNPAVDPNPFTSLSLSLFIIPVHYPNPSRQIQEKSLRLLAGTEKKITHPQKRIDIQMPRKRQLLRNQAGS